MTEFADREKVFRSRYGDNPLAGHYKGVGFPEPDARIAYREILRLQTENRRMKWFLQAESNANNGHTLWGQFKAIEEEAWERLEL